MIKGNVASAFAHLDGVLEPYQLALIKETYVKTLEAMPHTAV
jgi:hypothetical protein